MGFHRRRHHQTHHRHRFCIRAVSAIFVALLFLYIFILMLAPSPNDDFSRRIHDPSGDKGISHGIKVPNFVVSTDGGAYKHDIWTSRNSQFYYGCSDPGRKYLKAASVTLPDRYLLIATSGGLNQQRTGVIDAVAAARILNATLVVPKMDTKSFWKDSSNFSDIFDVDWFISHLANDVKIIKELPLRRGQTWSPHTTRVPRKCNEKCYTTRVLPLLLQKQAVQLNKFDYRLSNRLATEYQKLRCRVNYHALKFTDTIVRTGQMLVQRMQKKSKHYIALHLRFEPDMLAFSGCYYGGGDKERQELAKIRKRWKTLHIRDPEKGRRQGRCPLTPEEVGLMLRALGYGKDVHIYVASGEVYGGEKTLAPLKALFPNFYSKETLASNEELNPFSVYSSRMAALDFIVCDESDVFVTNNNGNMAKILAGRRRYFGHKPTIRPNAKKLYRVLLNRDNMTWEEFESRVRKFQRGFIGEPQEVRPGRGEFHENPAACICEDPNAKTKKIESTPRKVGKEKVADIKQTTDADDNNDDGDDDDQSMEDDEMEWAELEDNGELNDVHSMILANRTGSDYDGGLASEEPELDLILSD